MSINNHTSIQKYLGTSAPSHALIMLIWAGRILTNDQMTVYLMSKETGLLINIWRRIINI